jgi:exonuclease SbcC
MSLKSVTLKGFQRHDKLRVEFDPKVTTIVGASDAGKSAVVRALAFALLNKWHPSYLRHGSAETTVSVDVGGKKIVRTKGKKSNVYQIDGKEFKAFGTSVPSELLAHTNTGPENFQRQLDLHFWFSDTPGRCAQALNRIVNLESIDRSLQYLATEHRKARNVLEVTHTRYKDTVARKKKLKWIPDLDRDLKRLEALEIRSREKSHRIASIAFSIENASRHKVRARIASDAILGAKTVLGTGQRASKLRNDARKLSKLVTEARKQHRLTRSEIPDLSELIALRKVGDATAEKRRVLEAYLEDAKLVETQLCETTEDLNTTETQLAKKAVGRCPTCGRSLSPSSVPTSTCGPTHRSAGPRKKTGSKSRPGI